MKKLIIIGLMVLAFACKDKCEDPKPTPKQSWRVEVADVISTPPKYVTIFLDEANQRLMFENGERFITYTDTTHENGGVKFSVPTQSSQGYYVEGRARGFYNGDSLFVDLKHFNSDMSGNWWREYYRSMRE